MVSILKYLHEFYLNPFNTNKSDTIICVNSFAKTDKRYNYITEKAEHDDDEERIIETDIGDYYENFNK